MLTFKTQYAEPASVYGISAVGTKGLGPVKVHAQFGLSNSNGFTETNTWFYGLAGDYGLLKWLNIIAEVTGEYNKDVKPVSVRGGVIITPMDLLAIDLAAGMGITDEADDLFITAGVTFNL